MFNNNMNMKSKSENEKEEPLARHLAEIADAQYNMAAAQADWVTKYAEIEYNKDEKDTIKNRVDDIKYKENQIYKMISDISNFIVDCYEYEIEINYDESILNYKQFSLANLRTLILNYFEFLKQSNLNNMSEEEFEEYRENNFIAKMPPFLALMSDVLFPREIYIEEKYTPGKFMLAKDIPLSKSLKDAIKDDNRFEFMDKVPFFPFRNPNIYGPKIDFEISLVNESEKSKKIRIKDLKRLSLKSFKFKNIFFSMYQCCMSVNVLGNWQNKREREDFSFWNPLSIDYHTKASNYVNFKNDEDYNDEDYKGMLLDQFSISTYGYDLSPEEKNCETLNRTDLKIIFEETNPSYRFTIPGEIIQRLYEGIPRGMHDSYVFYGNFKFEFDGMWILDILYEMAIGEYNSICQNQDIYEKEYSRYLDDLINKYNLIYKGMQMERVNKAKQRLLLRKTNSAKR